MNRGLSFVMTSTLGMAVGFLMGQTPRKAGAEVEAARSIDAAFYDGEFQAQLDAENGRKPHIQSGRWITDGDRVLFIAGYQQAYRRFAADRPGVLDQLAAAEAAGYRDGVLDGELHRKAMQPFRMKQTEKYLDAGGVSWEASTVSESYKRDYRLAYANGYQVGYYSKAQAEDLGTANNKLSKK